MNPQQVRSFTTYINTIKNVLINEVHITSPQQTPQAGPINLNPNCRKYNAIWDTGATKTVITKKVVDECNLKPIGVQEIHTVSGHKKANTYLIDIWLPNKVIVNGIVVIEGELLQGVDVLIGMDIINLGDFAITNYQGKTIFTYRVPSVEVIDFVKKPYRARPNLLIPKKK